jgi:predicted Rossmann fold nucleotide-binding protein DprA/Smf involved in DNA uptake
MKKFNLKTGSALVAAGATSFVGSAQAAIDTAAITTALTDAGTAAAVVGSAVLVVYVGIKAFKLIKGAL